MELRVLGCHGGETPKHRTSAFLLDGRLAIDAGSLTGALELKEQYALEAAAVSHAHLDHIRDLATLVDNRCQAGCPTLPIAGTRQTIAALKKHFFNNKIWPDFSVIPTPAAPTIRWVQLPMRRTVELAGYRITAIPVSHTIEAAALLIEGPEGSIAYSGDTGPTDLLWEVLAKQDRLRALVMEVSFPNRQQPLATVSGHHTPRTLAVDLRKLERPKDLATVLFHIKPRFQAEVERECAALRGLNLTVAALGDRYRLLDAAVEVRLGSSVSRADRGTVGWRGRPARSERPGRRGASPRRAGGSGCRVRITRPCEVSPRSADPGRRARLERQGSGAPVVGLPPHPSAKFA
jgi:ribonuclease BN (tRNA processing enzyme)